MVADVPRCKALFGRRSLRSGCDCVMVRVIFLCWLSLMWVGNCLNEAKLARV